MLTHFLITPADWNSYGPVRLTSKSGPPMYISYENGEVIVGHENGYVLRLNINHRMSGSPRTLGYWLQGAAFTLHNLGVRITS